MSSSLIEGIEAQIIGGLIVVLAGIPFVLWFGRYLDIFKGSETGADEAEKEAYERIRTSLKNSSNLIYADLLKRFLVLVDKFFGDAHLNNQRAFGMRTPAALWTAPALDRCLLLALLYPFVSIYFIWAASGRVGPAEQAFLLPAQDLASWPQRVLLLTALGAMPSCFRGMYIADNWRTRLFWFAALPVAFADAGAVAFAFAGAVTFAVVVAFAVAVAGAFVFSGAGVVAAAVAVAFAFAGAGVVPVAVAGAFAVVVAGVFAVRLFDKRAIAAGHQGRFLSLFLALGILLCLVSPWMLASSNGWLVSGPLLLFLGLLTFLNAPFDWLSLGLTRALLRRGLELQKWWPYAFALFDVIAAMVIVALLAVVMVVGVQTFDELAVLRGGDNAAVLPLDDLFDGIAKSPLSPEYYWVYVLLFSTFIPSLFNLTIATASLVRGFPPFAKLLLNLLPDGKPVPSFNRTLVAAGLMAHWISGFVFSALALGFLFFVVLGFMRPVVGFDMLSLAHGVAALDIPGHLLGIAH